MGPELTTSPSGRKIMKKFLGLLALAMSVPLIAQTPVYQNIIFTGFAPSGSCAPGSPAQIVISTGLIYTCQSGTWAEVSGGGGGGFTAGGDLTGSSTDQTVVGINGTNLAGLASGFLLNTTGTGVPISVPADYSAGSSALTMDLGSFSMTSPTNASSVSLITTSADFEEVRLSNSILGNANISFSGTQGDAVNYVLPYNPTGSGGSYGAGTFAVFNGTPVAGDCLNVDTNLTTFDVATCPSVPAIATGNAAVGNGTGITDAGAPPLLLGMNGSAPVGTLYEIYNCQGADPADGNAINAKLAAGAGVYLTLVGACEDNTVTINLQSNQTLDGGGSASILFHPSVVPTNPLTAGYLQNIASQEAATRTFADGVTTAGSATMTSATAAFTASDEAQGITCQGILGSGITEGGVAISNFMSTTIQYVNSATSVQLVDPIPVGATGVSCSIYYRDRNITVRGLKIINNGPPCTAGNNDNWWVTFFQNINYLTLQGDTFQDGATGLTGSNGCKSVEISAASNIQLLNNNLLTWLEFQDGFDLFGPLTDLYETGTTGFTGDDINALQTSTLEFIPFSVQGPIHNIVITGVNMGSGTAALKTYGPDQYGPLPITNVTFSHVRGIEQITRGTAGQNMFRGLYIVGGTQDNFTVDDISGDVGVAVALNGNLAHGLFRNISIDPVQVSSTTRYVYTFANQFQPNPIYGDLDIEGVRMNGPLDLNSAISFTDVGARYSKIKISDFENQNALQNTVPYISINAASVGILDISGLDIPTLNSTANVAVVQVGNTANTIPVGQIEVSNSQMNIGSTTFGPLPFLNLINLSNSPLISFNNVRITSATAGTNGYLVGSILSGSNTAPTPPSFIFQNNFLSNITGCIQRINSVNTNPTDWSNVTSISNSFNVTTASTCPPSNQFGPSRSIGITSSVGLNNHYDSITLAGVSLPTNAVLSQTATGGGGSLTDNTTFFYKVCGMNSVGAHCGNELSILVCAASTCSNLSTVTLAENTQVAFAQTYNIYRGTTSGGELLCGSLTGLAPYLESIVDTGNACSGVAVPTTNTSIPSIVMGNTDGSHTTTFSPSTATSSTALNLPATSGTLALTSQIPAGALTATTPSIGGSLVAVGCTAFSTVTVTGASTGQSCLMSGAGGAQPANIQPNCFVSAANTVTPQLCTAIVLGVTPAAQTYNLRVF